MSEINSDGVQRPRISVVTPTKNRFVLLQETMESVAVQTFADWEHIIVDDGSDDGTEDYVLARAASDPRVRFIKRAGERSGGNVCRNIGLREARGEYVMLLDSDDLLRPHCLAQRVAVMERNLDLDFAAFGSGKFTVKVGDLGPDQTVNSSGDALLRFLCFDLPWIMTGPVWRKTTLERLGGLDETLPSWQDIDLHVRALTSGTRHIQFDNIDNDVRWQFEPTKVSVQQRRSMEHLRTAATMFEKFEVLVRQGPGMDWSRQRAICGLYFLVSEMMLQAGGLREALACWREVRSRGLALRGLHYAGTLLLFVQSAGWFGVSLTDRLTNKWKGFVRFRINAELVAP